MEFKKIAAKDITANPFEVIDDQWMLVTGGTKDACNTMTASWGGVGILWHMPVAFTFIRKSRYTMEFIEKNDCYTLNFFGDAYRDALNYCGTVSGRDENKIQKAGLTPVEADCGAIYFAEAETVFVCRKLYSDDMDEKDFIDPKINKFYLDHDYHRMYIGEIIEVLKK